MKPLLFAVILLETSLIASAAPYQKIVFETESSSRHMGTIWQAPQGHLLLQACDYENYRRPLVFDDAEIEQKLRRMLLNSPPNADGRATFFVRLEGYDSAKPMQNIKNQYEIYAFKVTGILNRTDGGCGLTDYLDSVAAGRGEEFIQQQESSLGWEKGTVQKLLKKSGYTLSESNPLGISKYKYKCRSDN